MSSTPVLVGHSLAGKDRVALATRSFHRSIYVKGPIGSGKTSLYRRYVASRRLREAFVLFDYAGTGVAELRKLIAAVGTALAIAAGAGFIDPVKVQQFLRRFPILALDAGTDLPPIRIDLLHRYRLADGRRESVQHVVQRVMSVIASRIDDPSEEAVRVRFGRVAPAALSVLSAAGRPITELHKLFDEPRYLGFLDRALDDHPRQGLDIAYVEDQRRELGRIFSLQTSKAGPASPRYLDEVSSTRNAFSDFRPGTILGSVFGESTIDIAAVAEGRQSLLLTTTLTQPVLKRLAFRAVHSIIHGLLATRPMSGGKHRRVLLIVDEIGWVPNSLHDAIAVARNLRAAYFICHQQDAQWDHMEMPALKTILPSLCPLRVTFTPKTFEEAQRLALETVPIDPLGMVLPILQKSRATTDSWGDTIGDSWSRISTDSLTDSYAPDPETGVEQHAGRSNQRSSGLQNGGTSSRTTGGSTTETETILQHVVGFFDQIALAAQDILREDSHTATIQYENLVHKVRMAPPPVLPGTLFGIDTVSEFQCWHNRVFSARVTPRLSPDYGGTIHSESEVPPPPAGTGSEKPYDTKRHYRPGHAPKVPVDGGEEET